MPGKSSQRDHDQGEAALPPKVAPREMERMHMAMRNILEKQNFDSPEEMNAFIQEHFTGRTIDEIIAEDDSEAPEMDALELAEAGMEASSREEAAHLCKQALALDPWCPPALQLQAALNSSSDKDYIKRLGAAIKKIEKHWGPEFMRENEGHFWGMVETRPYMRMRAEYIILLKEIGNTSAAIREIEKSLRLNPGDNQGFRYELVELYLRQNNLGKLRKLLQAHDDSLAIFQWARVLERFLAGKPDAAELLAHKAHADNPHSYAFLVGDEEPDYEPEYMEFGGESEAIECYNKLGEAWRQRPEAMLWLEGIKLR